MANNSTKIAWEDVGIISNLLRKYEPQYTQNAIGLYTKVAAEYNRAIAKIGKDNAEAGA